MSQFRYEAKRGKDLIKGILSADTKDAAIDKIIEMGLVPVELFEEKGGGKQSRVLGRNQARSLKSSRHTLIVFYRQLSRLLKSGVPLLPALVLVSEQAEEGKYYQVLDAIKNQVRQGQSLAEAMAEYPEIFNAFTLAVVEIGAHTGHLDDALQRLADYYEKQSATRQKVKNALTYPIFVLALGGLALVFLLSYVVPKFSKLFLDLGQALPWLTRVLVGLSEMTCQYGFWFLLGTGVLVFFVHNRLKIRAHRLSWDRLKLRLPLVGKIIFMAQFALFARSMEMLLKGGVPLLKALRTAIPAVPNEAMKEDLLLVERLLEQGASFSDSLKSGGAFPIFAIHLLLVGEQTGRMDQSFEDIADWYEKESSDAVRSFVQLIEPVTIFVIGAVLGIVAIAILLPVFSIDTLVS